MYFFPIFPLFLVHLVSAEKKGFVLIAPSSFGSQERVCVSFNSPIAENLSVSLLAHKADDVIASANATISGTYGCLKIPIDLGRPIVGSLARLEATISNSDKSYVAKISRTVRLLPGPWLTLISTDKPIYGAHDFVHIRAFIVDRNLLPLSEEVEKLWVENPQGVVVQEENNVTPTFGLVESSFQLVNDPFPGIWKVKLRRNGYTSTGRTFLVQKHVIPLFNVSIIAPDSMEANTGTEITVCAKYTFGKPVQGYAVIKMAVVCDFEYYCKNELVPFSLNITLDSEGCAREKVSAERLDGPYSQYVVFNASVQEIGSGVVGEKLKKIVLLPMGARSTIKGSFQLITNQIKPGLPFHGQFILTSDLQNWEPIDVKLCRSFDDEKVCTVSETHNGVIPFTIPPTKSAEKNLIQAFWTNTDGTTSSSFAYLRPWISSTSSYVQILLPQLKTLQCDGTLKIDILHTFDVGQEFLVMLKSRGNIVFFQNASSLVHFIEGEYNSNEPQRLILGSKTVDTPIRFISFELKTPANWSPEAALVVFTTTPQEVVADSAVLRFEHCFPFSVETVWDPPEAEPGDTVSLSITTEPHSLCAISVVDSRVSLLEEQTASLSSRIFQELFHKYPTVYPRHVSHRCVENKTERTDSGFNHLTREPTSSFSDSLNAFESSGFIVASDLTLLSRPCISSNEIEPRNSESANINNYNTFWHDEKTNEVSLEATIISIRTEFPDVFLWSSFFNGENKTNMQTVVLPGTITNWTSQVVCLSPKRGFSISNPATIRSFQPFFVKFSLPATVGHHERIYLAVSVFNYINTSAPIMLTIVPSKNFHIYGNLKTAMCVPANQKLVHIFEVVAVKLGPAKLAVKAEIDPHVAENCGPFLHQHKIDIIEKSTTVKAAGEEIEEIQSGLICGNSLTVNNETGWSIKMSSPEYVPNSISCTVRVSGDVWGPTISGIENLIQKPTGCGEQTAMTLAINRMIVKYLSATSEPNEMVQSIILEMFHDLNLINQKLLTFRHGNGSFSAFGPESESKGSIWLTAFILPYLDSRGTENVAQGAKKWILNHQLENGCFPKIGEIYHWNKKRGDSPIALTAFITIQLLAAGISEDDPVIKNALLCLTTPNPETDVYSDIITTYAIALAGDKRVATARMQTILKQAKKTCCTLLWWEDSEASTLESTIEMTSYAILALIKVGLNAPAAGAVRWILQYQNSNGGFVSTQDTLVALTALAAYSNDLPRTDGLNVTIKYANTDKDVEISKPNRELLRVFEIPPFTTNINFKAVGSGCALVQTALKYNVRKAKRGKTLKIDLRVDPIFEGFFIEACVKTLDEKSRTNMAIMDVNLPSGFYPDRTSLYRTTESQKGVKKFEEFEDHVDFYFNKLTNHKRCVSFLIKKENCVENPTPILVRVYDYYNSMYSASVRHKIQQSCNESNSLETLPNILHLRNRRNTYQTESTGLFSNFRDVSHDLEAPNEVANGFKLYAMPPATGKENEKCPRCLNEAPDILPKLYCSAQVAAQIRFRGKHLLDLMKDVSPQTNFTKIQRSVAFSVKHTCSCDLISPGSKVLMLVTPPRKFNLQSIQIFHIDDNITLIPWKSVARFVKFVADLPSSCMDILTSD